jgi:hypothetical protein
MSCPETFPERLSNTTKTLSQDSRSPCRHLNPGPPDYEAGLLSTGALQTVQWLALVLLIRGVQNSVLGPHVGCPEAFRYFSQPLQCTVDYGPNDRVSIPGKVICFSLRIRILAVLGSTV